MAATTAPKKKKVDVLKDYAKSKGPALDLSDTDIVLGGGLAIYMRNVQTLNLSRTDFQAGSEEFWNVVTTSRVLTSLHLSGAKLTQKAADGLCKALKTTKIESLDISGNPDLGDDAGRQILDAITPQVKELKCSGCFSQDVHRQLMEKVNSNRQLKGLSVDPVSDSNLHPSFPSTSSYVAPPGVSPAPAPSSSNPNMAPSTPITTQPMNPPPKITPRPNVSPKPNPPPKPITLVDAGTPTTAQPSRSPIPQQLSNPPVTSEPQPFSSNPPTGQPDQPPPQQPYTTTPQGYATQTQQGYTTQIQQGYTGQPQQGYTTPTQQGYTTSTPTPTPTPTQTQTQQGYTGQPQQGYTVPAQTYPTQSQQGFLQQDPSLLQPSPQVQTEDPNQENGPQQPQQPASTEIRGEGPTDVVEVEQPASNPVENYQWVSHASSAGFNYFYPRETIEQFSIDQMIFLVNELTKALSAVAQLPPQETEILIATREEALRANTIDGRLAWEMSTEDWTAMEGFSSDFAAAIIQTIRYVHASNAGN
ncbi:hypothetical protein Pelo_7757 [Pelomyxa schiedti]|nr:hypothetical protein Pelo_7757 [Pelomyxa schiedti]